MAAPSPPAGFAALRARVAGGETFRAAGLAGAMIVTNVVALALTIVFGRILGTGGYGEVAALISAFLILSVPGQALQLVTARSATLGELGEGGALRATLEGWTVRLAVAAVVAFAIGALLRRPLADIVGVEAVWGAAALLPTAVTWVLLSIQRGALQAIGAYRDVGASMVLEQVARLAIGATLAVAGLGATGAYLGSPLAMVAMVIVLDGRLRRALGHAVGPGLRSLRRHARTGAAAMVGLAVIAALQNIDVIVAKHRLADDPAGAYAAAAVAAKVVVWVSIGLALWVVPEAARRAAAGRDPLGVLLRGLALLVAAALPALAIFAVAPELLLKAGFGPKFGPGGDALLLLGVAMSVLAAVGLSTQYLLALHRWRFLVPLGAVAIAEPFVLFLPHAARPDIARFVLIAQLLAAVVVGVAVLRGRRAAPR